MTRSPFGPCGKRVAVAMALIGLARAGPVHAQGPRATATPQKIDEEYTARIKKILFANRPFWRWQTQGSFFLAFNAILNRNDLNAGRTAPRPTATAER